MNIDILFFELLRVAIGTQVCLTRTPSAAEWDELYNIAKKQSLLGVCFAGVQRLQLQHQCPGEILYLTWMGMAAKIQQRNQIVDEQCALLQKRISASGFRSCILKGQGVAQLYTESLRGLRQPGDIDIWVDGEIDRILNWITQIGVRIGDVDSVHVPVQFFYDTIVEVHFRPSYMYNRTSEKMLMRFFDQMKDSQMRNKNPRLGFSYPEVAFNLVFSMVHINRHIYSEGIGLRQLMDYYFILLSSTEAERKSAMVLMDRMYLSKFIAGIMYIISNVFGITADRLLCVPSEKEGVFLLHEIMVGGNFGHYDSRNSDLPQKNMRWLRGWWTIKRVLRYLTHYPQEVLSIPAWKLKHYMWRKSKKYI